MTAVEAPFVDDPFGDLPELLGTGEIGGKARGLQRLSAFVKDQQAASPSDELHLFVPPYRVITTSHYLTFLEDNSLTLEQFKDDDDLDIARRFLEADLPASLVGPLWTLVTLVRVPIAVRSSSRLEDALGEPFAGIYETKMLPNHHNSPEKRFEQIAQAIKLVYASTWFARAREYRDATGHPHHEEAMAVILQTIVGERHDDRFYPHLSGVARSFNYYPFGNASPEDGVVTLALGLGRIIVDEGVGWSYCPSMPRTPPPFGSVSDLLKQTQTRFWAVDLSFTRPQDPLTATEYMSRFDLADAEWDETLQHLVSTYDPQRDRLWTGCAGKGARVLDFSPLLKASVYPVNDVIKNLLETIRERLGTPVEVEFAAILPEEPGTPAKLALVQVRPMVVNNEIVRLKEEDLTGDTVLVSSPKALGNGRRDDLNIVTYVKTDTFDAAKTRAIGDEIRTHNLRLRESGQFCVLIGFGRWGSSDPWLGIPVTWGEISQARVLVECALEELNVELSQGSHFFHNICSFRVSYFSVKKGLENVRFDLLSAGSVLHESPHVVTVALDKPLHVSVDGTTGRGVITV